MTDSSITDGLVRASSIHPIRTEWLRPGLIPIGSISVLAGEPGVGKSTWTLQLVADLSRGRLTGSPRESLVITAEDSLAGTVRPRLQAAGADLERVLFPSEDATLSLPSATTQIERWLEGHDVGLVIIDPLSAFVGAGVDTWKDSSIRGVLKPLAKLAERHNLAVLLVAHLNKGYGSDPIRRLGGSIGLPAAARSVLVLGYEPGHRESDRRVLAHTKSNFDRLAGSRLYRIQRENDATQPHVIELGPSDINASDLLSEPESPRKLDEAMGFLRQELAGGGRPANELVAEAEGIGISKSTTMRAKIELGVRSTKIAFDHWAWSLPENGEPADDSLAA